jgi:hypothetical protein
MLLATFIGMERSSIILILILLVNLGASAADRPGELPVECIRYSLDKSFPRIAEGESSQYFVKCISEKADPIPGQVRPHYSDYEVKSLHKAFVSITDCLDIEPQLILPKLMMESGFHVQIQNPNGDAGIGQLTSKAIGDVDSALPAFKEMIFKSKKPSCIWIRGMTAGRSQFWKPVLGESKCTLMARQSNPLRNLLYTAIFHKLNERYVEREFEDRKISDLLFEAGYPGTDFTALKRILVTLGYNTGGKVAVKNLLDYLFSRIDFINRKQMEFKFDPYDLGLVSPSDFDFTAGLATFNAKKEKLKSDLQKMHPQLSEEKIQQAVQRMLRDTSVSQYTFPEWLKVWQSHGGPGYVSSLAGFSQLLDKAFGPGICSDASSYQLLKKNPSNDLFD